MTKLASLKRLLKFYRFRSVGTLYNIFNRIATKGLWKELHKWAYCFLMILSRERLKYEAYKDYLENVDTNNAKSNVREFTVRPLISIILPVYNTAPQFLENTINSVKLQLYKNWELCIVDDCSNINNLRKIIKSFSEEDERIRFLFLENNTGISRASNYALSLASGEYIGFLDHDDLLTPNALYEVVKAINKSTKPEWIYSDEDKVNMIGKRYDPFFKPDWSPDLLLSQMYTCHFSVYKKYLIYKVGGFRSNFDGSQDYDLALRISEITNNIYHIPKVLYSWRSTPGSAASSTNAKKYAYPAAKMALEEALSRRGILGSVEYGRWPGTYYVRRSIIGSPIIDIIIPTKDNCKLLSNCIDSIISNTDYDRYNIKIINNGSLKNSTYEYFKEICRISNISIHSYHKSFNYSAINNYAATLANGEHILLLNNDVEVINSNWITALLEHSQRENVGAVGAKLLYPDNSIQHAGIVIGMKGLAGHSHRYLSDSFGGYFKRSDIIHNVSAVTGACMMIKRKVFWEVGGFDERFQVAFGDVDLCLRLTDSGYSNIYTPHSKLYHYESSSRGCDSNTRRFKKESQLLKRVWKDYINKGDPFYNPNLSLYSEKFKIKNPKEEKI